MSNKLKSSVMSGVKWLSFSKLLIQLFRWLSTFWVIRQLNSFDYGVIAIAEVIMALLMSINYLCIGNAIIKFNHIKTDTLNSLYTIALLIGFFLASLQYLIAPFFASFYQTVEAEDVLKVLSIVFIIDSLCVYPMAALAKNMEFKKLALIDLSIGTIMPITVVSLAYLGFGYWSLAIGHLANSFGRLFALNYYFPNNLKISFKFQDTKEMLTFGIQNALSSIIAQLNSSIDIMIGGYFMAVEKIGYYQVGLQVSLIPLRKISPELRRIALPAYSSLNEDLKKTAIYFLKSNRLISIVIFPIFWGIGSTSQTLVNVLLTEKWSESIIVIQLISFVLPFKLLNETNCSMLNALGRADVVLKNTILTLSIFILSIILFINYELKGLAMSWLVTTLASYIILTIRTRNIIHVKIITIINTYVYPAINALIMSIILLYLQQNYDCNSTAGLFTLILIGSIIYGAMSFIFNKNALKELLGLIKK